MNKVMKKFLATGLSTAFLLGCGVGAVSAAKVSQLETVSVPRWGAWSNFSKSRVEKTSSSRPGINLNTAPHWFPLYGQIYDANADDKDQKALVSDVPLTVEEYKYGTYKAGRGKIGNTYKAAIASSNFEPDVRRVTYRFKP